MERIPYRLVHVAKIERLRVVGPVRDQRPLPNNEDIQDDQRPHQCPSQPPLAVVCRESFPCLPPRGGEKAKRRRRGGGGVAGGPRRVGGDGGVCPRQAK